MATYDDKNPEQGIDTYNISEDGTNVSITFKGGSRSYTVPCDSTFKRLLESGDGATRYYIRNFK